MVSSYLQLITNRYADELDEDGEEFNEFAVNSADRMGRMIDDFSSTLASRRKVTDSNRWA
jgi:light-regulated signal transduction histidine kinase (bacteriophytochrome)